MIKSHNSFKKISELMAVDPFSVQIPLKTDTELDIAAFIISRIVTALDADLDQYEVHDLVLEELKKNGLKASNAIKFVQLAKTTKFDDKRHRVS